MRLFISYARVDKPYCLQIIDTLDAHETWLDQRLYAGQQWWKEILRRLDWCEGFIYLVSPDSIASDYCRKEFELAKNLGRHIFPVIVHENTHVPAWLTEYQFVDLTKGINLKSLQKLLNSITLAEREQRNTYVDVATLSESTKQPMVNPTSIIRVAAQAMEKGDYDQVVFLLRQAKASNSISHYINVDVMLQEAEAALNRKSYLLQAERGYRQIVEMFNHRSTSKLAWLAFQEFQKDFPEYDPDQLAQRTTHAVPGATEASAVALTEVSKTTGRRNGGNDNDASLDLYPPRLSLPLLEWCEIPAGQVSMVETNIDNKSEKQTYDIEQFYISKYPITNAQYQAFLDDPSGYCNIAWWQYSQEAYQWRMKNLQPRESKFKGDERPRETVTWYEAVAFCEWLSSTLNAKICLPTSAQWQRAFQGDDDRIYPWGNTFELDCCNTVESQLKMTTLVTRYPNGVSPYGVYDMAGNVWEWCCDNNMTNNGSPRDQQKRIVRGGSYIGPHQRANVAFQFELEPESYHASVGFRLIRNN